MFFGQSVSSVLFEDIDGTHSLPAREQQTKKKFHEDIETQKTKH